jgi:hypothetical protein
MKQGSTLFLKGVVIVLGVTTLAVCIFGIPYAISTDQTGAYRPILLGMYVPAIPFFLALYQAFKLLIYIDKNQAFSELSVRALKNIKYCAVTISGMYAAGMPYIYQVADKDDAPGVVAIGLVIVFASIVIATFAAVLQKLIQNGLEIKSENELTV